MSTDTPPEYLIDFVTGCTVPDTGAEANRQQVERFLVEDKGYAPEDIEVDAPITVNIEDETYTSSVDLVVSVHDRRYMAIKCAPGSLASREREILSAARLLDEHLIPVAISSDGSTALVWDTVSGDSLGEGLDAVPSKAEAERAFDPALATRLDEKRRGKLALIFRSYDLMNIRRR